MYTIDRIGFRLLLCSLVSCSFPSFSGERCPASSLFPHKMAGLSCKFLETWFIAWRESTQNRRTNQVTNKISRIRNKKPSTMVDFNINGTTVEQWAWSGPDTLERIQLNYPIRRRRSKCARACIFCALPGSRRNAWTVFTWSVQLAAIKPNGILPVVRLHVNFESVR